MFTVSATWLLLGLISAGLGLAIRRAFIDDEIDADSLLLAFWIGLAASASFLLVWHLAQPIRWPAFTVVALAGCAGLIANHRALRAWLKRVWRRPNFTFLTGAALVCLWIANQAMGPNGDYDGGMYHIPVIEWSRMYAAVPGLGNLHERLAFNNSTLLYATMLDIGFWRERSQHLVHGLLLSVLALQILLRFRQLPAATGSHRARCIFDIALSTPLVYAILRPDYVSSLNTDLPVAIILLVAISLLVERLPQGATDRRHTFELMTAALLLAFAVTTKISSAPVAGLLWLGAMLSLARNATRGTARTLRPLAGGVLLSLALIVPWSAHGVILSGYPLFPATILPFDVDWRMPAEQAAAVADWVGYSARIYNALNFRLPFSTGLLFELQWVPMWLRGLWDSPDGRWFVTAPLLALFVLALVAARNGHRNDEVDARERRTHRFLFLVLLGGAFLWFFVAPRPEFGFPYTWGLVSITAVLSARVLARHRRTLVMLTLAAAFVLVLDDTRVSLQDEKRHPLKAFARALIVPPGPDLFFHPDNPPRVEQFMTASGLRLWVPVRRNRCLRAPLPCTPHPAKNLELRGATLEDGFRTRGEWEPLRWPNPVSPFLAGWREAQSGEPH